MGQVTNIGILKGKINKKPSKNSQKDSEIEFYSE